MAELGPSNDEPREMKVASTIENPSLAFRRGALFAVFLANLVYKPVVVRAPGDRVDGLADGPAKPPKHRLFGLGVSVFHLWYLVAHNKKMRLFLC